MTRNWRSAGLLAFSLMLLLAAPAAAGGWATATITDPPDGPVAGEETSIGVDLKQHGVTPISWERLLFIGTHADTRELLVAEGRPEGPTGRYVIEVTFPVDGSWEWQLQTMDLLMEQGHYPTISVAPGFAGAGVRVSAASTPTPGAALPAASAGIDPVLAFGIALLAFLGGALSGTVLRRPAPTVKPIAIEVPSVAR